MAVPAPRLPDVAVGREPLLSDKRRPEQPFRDVSRPASFPALLGTRAGTTTASTCPHAHFGAGRKRRFVRPLKPDGARSPGAGSTSNAQEQGLPHTMSRVQGRGDNLPWQSDLGESREFQIASTPGRQAPPIRRFRSRSACKQRGEGLVAISVSSPRSRRASAAGISHAPSSHREIVQGWRARVLSVRLPVATGQTDRPTLRRSVCVA